MVDIASAQARAPQKRYRAVWSAALVLLALFVYTARPRDAESLVAAFIIFAASVIPALLWITGRSGGLPLFPIFTLTHIGTYALPLVYEHPRVALFSPDDQLFAAISVAGSLLVGTAVWYTISRPRSAKHGNPQKLFRPRRRQGGSAFPRQPCCGGGMVDVDDWPVDNVARRSVVNRFCGDACRAGARLFCNGLPRRCSPVERSEEGSLLGAVRPFGDYQFAIISDDRRDRLDCYNVPRLHDRREASTWRAVMAMVCLFALLHLGKGPIRQKYWFEREVILQP